jgi:AcrR family transcriptional regulator
MARTVKKAAERREEILQTARQLFYSHGYDATSVNMIIQQMGISKGAFYHHFKSKEELLDTLIQRFTDEIMIQLEPIRNDPNLDALEKLNRIFMRSSILKLERFDFIVTLIKAIYQSTNYLLRQKLNESSIASALPLMTEVLTQGKEEGVFCIEHPAVVARMLLQFSSVVSGYNGQLLLQLADNPACIDDVQHHLRFYKIAVERMLGAPQNSMVAYDDALIEGLVEYYRGTK